MHTMLSVRPPEYFPGLSFVALMASTATFVMADTMQYSRQSLQNRTRVRNRQGAQWVTVPLAGGQHGQSQTSTRLSQSSMWRKRHWKSFRFNYSRSPYFEHYEAVLADFFRQEYSHLAELTCASVALTHRLFGLDSLLVRASDLPAQPNSMASIAVCFRERTLLLPPTAALIDRHAAAKVMVLDYRHPVYTQVFAGFEPDMTALDLLFNYGPDSLSVLKSGISIIGV